MVHSNRLILTWNFRIWEIDLGLMRQNIQDETCTHHEYEDVLSNCLNMGDRYISPSSLYHYTQN